VTSGLFDSLNSFADLEARIAASPEEDRGDAFEVFAEAYLATQKIVEAEEVWPDRQVPIAVLQACGLPLKDMGADGVYKTYAGQYNAYQSKFRTGPSVRYCRQQQGRKLPRLISLPAYPARDNLQLQNHHLGGNERDAQCRSAKQRRGDCRRRCCSCAYGSQSDRHTEGVRSPRPEEDFLIPQQR
jgi:hypothetical protein